MLSKQDRFQKWRGNEASKEKTIIDTALLIGEYLDGVVSADKIKSDFDSTNSPKYIELGIHKKRTLGALLYCKLLIDELLERTQSLEQVEKKVLDEITLILDKLYVDPMKYGYSESKELLIRVNQLLSMDVSTFSDKSKARELCLTLYTSVKIGKLWFNNKFSGFAQFGLSKIIGFDVNVELDKLIKLIDIKVSQLDSYCSDQASKAKEGSPRDIQAHLNERFLDILNVSESEQIKLKKIEASIHEVIDSTKNILGLRDKREYFEAKITEIEQLVVACEINETRKMGRQYFLDFIESHDGPVKALLDCVDSSKKSEFEKLMAQYENPALIQSVSGAVLSGLSTITAPLRIGFRALAPQVVQNGVAAISPETMDSTSKAFLKNMVHEQLDILRKELSGVNHKLKEETMRLAHDNPDLEKRLDHESTEALETLLKSNIAIKDAFETYSIIALPLYAKAGQAVMNRNTHRAISDFIIKHDDFFVAVSNFFAQFCSLFKTETATLIDEARKLQKALIKFDEHYKKVVDQELGKINKIPDLPQTVKERLKHEFAPAVVTNQVQSYSPVLTKDTFRIMLHDPAMQKIITTTSETDSAHGNQRGQSPVSIAESHVDTGVPDDEISFTPFRM